MAEGLSIAAGAAGLVSLGLQVVKSIIDFYTAYKRQDADLAFTLKKLKGLQEIFEEIASQLSKRSSQTQNENLSKNIEDSIQDCADCLGELQIECHKITDTAENGARDSIRSAGRRVAYPFRHSTLAKLEEHVDDIRESLNLALNVVQLKDNSDNQENLAEIKAHLKLIEAHQISAEIRSWLRAPDATIDHNVACAARSPGTGLWLIRSTQFEIWKTAANSILWLHAFAGAGKSVLCSTCIQDLLRLRAQKRGIGVAFFYFTFREESKQDASALLRALLLQLSCQFGDEFADLKQMHERYTDSVPPLEVLIEYLHRILERFHQVYIVIDALDESPRDTSRIKVMETIQKIRNWNLPTLHLFVTSRYELDIRDMLNLPLEMQITTQNEGMDADIAKAISSRLSTDRDLHKWAEHRAQIEEVLTKKSKGIFRWVDCQMKSLRNCPRSKYHLDHLLDSLPRSLHETYERMLCNIDSALVRDARRILLMICYARRRLSVAAIIDGVAVETREPGGLNRDKRLQDADDLLSICGGLISIEPNDAKYDNRNRYARIAHFSVQEYLESKEIIESPASAFALSNDEGHAKLVQICLIYSLDKTVSNAQLDYYSRNHLFPLSEYVCNWDHHYHRCARRSQHQLVNTVVEFLCNKTAFEVGSEDYFAPGPLQWPDPVFAASTRGLFEPLVALLGAGHALDYHAPVFNNALQSAAYFGHAQIVQLLIDHGANVNANGGQCGTALGAAAARGHVCVVNLLLRDGAGVSSGEEGSSDCTSEIAAVEGKGNVNGQLVQCGAYLNSESLAEAFVQAAGNGHEEVLRLLLRYEKGPLWQSGHCGPALVAAARRGSSKTLRLLMDCGADLNDEKFGYAQVIREAASWGRDSVVQLLLQYGAFVKVKARHDAEALQLAAGETRKSTVSLLLQAGADVNARGEYGDTALLAAIERGRYTSDCSSIVRMLLDHGADVNVRGKFDRSPLQAAVSKERVEIAKVLLAYGADMHDVHNESLAIACLKMRNSIMVQFLLANDPDVHARQSKSSTILADARLLLERFERRAGEISSKVTGFCDFCKYSKELSGVIRCTSCYDRLHRIIQLLLDYGAGPTEGLDKEFDLTKNKQIRARYRRPEETQRADNKRKKTEKQSEHKLADQEMQHNRSLPDTSDAR